ncbi:hypothetical protein CYMTET_13249 [Cymbomonas tetramitiformis]|uniref:Uncharacterized protein n=1 Tax=Cymbomonas tetramitiformis TaxID=36881 RepID=A0AAE0LBN2_9CHLO|nr:hypothetical protein CYMTET_13249 [Cymbomonas tetramitiformis]
MALREVDKRELFERLHSERLACKGLGLPPEKSSSAKDVAEATFTPKLNKQTQELVREMWDGVPRMSRIEYLYRQGVEKSRKLERRPKMRDSGVTLGPRTEPADYTNGAELFPWKHVDHYLTAMRDERESKDVMENCTFSPEINRNSKQYSKSYGRTPLLQRCSHWKLEREMKLNKERVKKETEDFSECTFQPAISNNISTLTLQEAQRMRLMRSLSPGRQLSKYHIEGSSWGDKWQGGLGLSRTTFHSSPSRDRPKSAPSLRSPLVAKTRSDGTVIPIHEHLHMKPIGNRKIFEDLPSQDSESVASLRRSLKYSPVRMKPEEENQLRSTVSSLTCSEAAAVAAADADDELPGILALLSQPQPPKPGDLEFEDKHCKRLSAARDQRNKKAELLNKYSGATWSPGATRPKEFKFAVKSRTGHIKSLKAPVTAENSPFNSLMRSSTSMSSSYQPVTPRS